MRPVLEVAPDLVGRVLVVQTSLGVKRYRIVEVEAYDGECDLACHASRGRTPRTETMYLSGGHVYVYLVYGMHHMLNIVTGDADYPAAVLIRGVEGISGPGRVTKRLGITREHNGRMLGKDLGIWVEEGEKVYEECIKRTPRVGVDYAEEWKDAPYRFVVKIV